MSMIAVNVAVLHDNKILLTKRDDFETWILPGGGVEDGESIAQAAIRDESELSPQQFYKNLIEHIEESEKVEVGNV